MISVVRARMRRRLLVTYRVDPDIAAHIVPAPFRPQLVRGSAVGGLCLIRLEALRPGWLAPEVGASSEAVAHRFAVEWDEGNVTRHGVYVSHRHSSSAIASLAGGRVFPGFQQHARIHTEESATRSRVRVQAGAYSAQADIEDADDWASELFDTPQQASDFYRAGVVGWSPRRGRSRRGLAGDRGMGGAARPRACDLIGVLRWATGGLGTLRQRSRHARPGGHMAA